MMPLVRRPCFMVLFAKPCAKSLAPAAEKRSMKVRSSKIRLFIALFAMGLSAFVFTGCEKGAEPPREPAAKKAPPRESPESYMNDPAFLKAVSGARKEMNEISAKLKPMQDRMQALVKEHGEDLGKLQNVPEWVKLRREATQLAKRYKELRQQQLATVRDRLTPEKPAAAAADKTLSK